MNDAERGHHFRKNKCVVFVGGVLDLDRFHFDFLFSVSVSLAVPRLLGDEIRIPRTDVNKKVKKYFHPIRRFFFTPTASPRSRMNARSAGGRC
jgi:hypothetical protein